MARFSSLAASSKDKLMISLKTSYLHLLLCLPAWFVPQSYSLISVSLEAIRKFQVMGGTNRHISPRCLACMFNVTLSPTHNRCPQSSSACFNTGYHSHTPHRRHRLRTKKRLHGGTLAPQSHIQLDGMKDRYYHLVILTTVHPLTLCGLVTVITCR